MTALMISPMLRTWDMARTKAFYTEVLGFTCRAEAPQWQWMALELDGLEIMFSGPNAHEGDKGPAFTGQIHVRTDDVDGMWARVQGRAKVCYEPEDMPYGSREFGIYDDSGYLLAFAQDLRA